MVPGRWRWRCRCRGTAYLNNDRVDSGLHTGKQSGRSNEAPHGDLDSTEEMSKKRRRRWQSLDEDAEILRSRHV